MRKCAYCRARLTGKKKKCCGAESCKRWANMLGQRRFRKLHPDYYRKKFTTL